MLYIQVIIMASVVVSFMFLRDIKYCKASDEIRMALPYYHSGALLRAYNSSHKLLMGQYLMFPSSQVAVATSAEAFML